MTLADEQKRFLTKILGEQRVRDIEEQMAERLFSGPVELMHDLNPDQLVEVEIQGERSTALQRELAEELEGIAGLETKLYSRKALDIPQIIYLAGATGGIIQGIDIV